MRERETYRDVGLIEFLLPSVCYLFASFLRSYHSVILLLPVLGFHPECRKINFFNKKMEEPSCADMCGYTKEGDNSGDIWCLQPNGQFETKVCGEDEIATEATSDSIDATSSSVTSEDTTTTSSASTTTSEKDEATTSNSYVVFLVSEHLYNRRIALYCHMRIS